MLQYSLSLKGRRYLYEQQSTTRPGLTPKTSTIKTKCEMPISSPIMHVYEIEGNERKGCVRWQ